MQSDAATLIAGDGQYPLIGLSRCGWSRLIWVQSGHRRKIMWPVDLEDREAT